jgi:hypothetical protein
MYQANQFARVVFITTIHNMPIHKVTTNAHQQVYVVSTPTAWIANQNVVQVIQAIMTLHQWNVKTAT